MKQAMPCLLALLLLLMAVFGHAQDASGLLEKSRKHVKAQHSIAYTYTAYWPNPVGEVDTLRGECRFVVGNQNAFRYDFVAKAQGRDMTYIGGAYREVVHDEKKVELHPDEEKAVRMFTKSVIPLKYSPIMLLDRSWQYVRDTTITHSLAGYRTVDLDTVVNGNRVYVELWLYIGKDSRVPEWYVQQSFFKGKRGQRIEFAFADYALSRTVEPLVYTLPVGYRSEVFGTTPGPQVLQAGTEAPVFQVVDLQGKPVDLKALRGKKVLLNFSIINCGYCKVAIDHMNRKDFVLPDNVVGVYINPIDKPDRVASYVQKSHISFPVVADAKTIGTLYGVSGYPTFFLIDEKGVIQETVVGYREAFLDGLFKSK
ncbi:TlpA family protein disulfide reductase [Parachryseolinea silvisoli]|uniref:TlpA family protein disulfide reductase n=1 Tax=Parachryseolinea silvisoli TaxID=2873601 RepID=UPI0022659811|nr:TlpA disulfide reductase family protein [Parachryseolinea silvisoli]MCD9020170.1 TlpA family protein disulfide reductase [Parachryseolinea silvisoli]